MSTPEERPPSAGGRTVGTGAALILSGNVVSVAAGITLGIVIARILGPEGTGTFNLIGSTQFILVALGTLGVGAGAQYYVSRGEWPVADALRQTQVAAAAIGLGVTGIGLLVALVLAPGAYEDVPLAGILIGIGAVPFILSWTFTSQAALGENRQEPYMIVYGGSALLSLALVAVLAPTLGVTGAIGGAAAAQLLAAVYLLGPWASRNLQAPTPGWLKRAPGRLREAAAYGVRAYVPGALQVFNYRGDLIILSASASSATVGHYSIALATALLAVFVPRSLSLVTTARVARLSSTGGGWESDMVTRKAVRHGILIAVVLAGGMAAVAPLIPLVYGSDFKPATELLLLLIPSAAGTAVFTVLIGIILGRGRPEYAMRAAIGTTIVALTLYLTLIPAYEAKGAAVASSISQVLGALLIGRYFRRLHPDLSLRDLLPGADELEDHRKLLGGLIRRDR